MSPTPPLLHIDIEHPLPGLSPAQCQQLVTACGHALSQQACPVGLSSDGWAASIVLSDNETVQGLNRQFRGKDKPTNVLSFPTDAADWQPSEPPYLGDIILATETLSAEAEAQQKPVAHHLQHLVLHGLLHLWGYDHLTPAEAEIMETLEISLLKALNIPDPYNY